MVIGVPARRSGRVDMATLPPSVAFRLLELGLALLFDIALSRVLPPLSKVRVLLSSTLPEVTTFALR